jgi:O-antigen/teichoic acid export membrane protein
MILLAPLVNDARLQPVLYALALSPLLHGLSNPRFVMFERDLVYSPLAVATLASKVTSFAVMLSIALLYRSYWALVVGLLAGNLTTSVLTYVLKPYRPRVTWSRFADIFAFSGWMSLTRMVTTVSMETDKIIVGRLLGVTDAGLYYMTQRVGVLPTRELVSPLQRILFPSFSEIAHDRARLRGVARESINVLGSLSLPAGFGFALVAGDFVPLALGDGWSSIVPLLTVLTPFLGVRATLSMALPCVMALGRTRLLFQVSSVYALVHLPAFIAGTALYGLEGAIWSIVLAGVFYCWLNAWMLRRSLGVSLGEILRAVRRPLAAALLMVGAVGVAAPLLPVQPGSLAALAAKMLLGGVVFCATQYLIWRLEGRPSGIERRLLQLLSG